MFRKRGRMSIFSNIAISKDIKAYAQSNDPPFVGDVRTTIDYPAGTKWSEITEFEVWDGHQWRGKEFFNAPIPIA